MKFIRKRGAPHAYTTWCKRVTGTAKADYGELSGQQKMELLSSLLVEQGWICAYTMKRLDYNSSHVEHIKPESRCRADKEGSDLDYENMVACFPREGMTRRYRYGAQEKDDWWENDGEDFVSPLHESCERRFRFDLQGNITAVGNSAAVNTIKILGLTHPTLVEERHRVIQEFVYGQTNDDPLSKAHAARAVRSICNLDRNGRFYEFCVAIRDAVGQHIRNLDRLTKKRRFAQQKTA